MLLREVQTLRRLLRIENRGAFEAEFLPDRSLHLLRLKCRGVSMHSPSWNGLDGPLLATTLPGGGEHAFASLYPESEPASASVKWRGAGRVRFGGGEWKWNRLIQVEGAESSISVFDRFEPATPSVPPVLGDSEQGEIAHVIELGHPLVTVGSAVLVGNANAGEHNGKGSQRFSSGRLERVVDPLSERTDFFPHERPYERPSVFVGPPVAAGENAIRLQITWDPLSLPYLTEEIVPLDAEGEALLLRLKLSGPFEAAADGDDTAMNRTNTKRAGGFVTSVRISVGAYGEDLR